MTNRVHSGVSFPVQIVTLWSVFLLGLLFHTQLGLMPLFHGLAVGAEHGGSATSIAEVAPVFWWMLLFFMVPLVAMTATVFWQSRRYRGLHFGVTVLYTGLNLVHLVMDLFVQPIAWYQIALMAFLVVIGLLLNWVAYQWMQSAKLHARPDLHPQTSSDELRIR